MGRLNDLDDAVRKSGLRVREQSGWRSRGQGGFRGARGLILHHTAGPASGNYPSLNVVMYGRPGLRNALSHLGLGRDGTVYIIASGLCWHAGTGSWSGLRGNSDCIGIEAESTGHGDWTSAQVDAYPRLVAALKAHYNIPNSRVIAHFEWTSRKIDPYRFPGGMSAIRSGKTSTPTPQPKPKEWDEMATKKEVQDAVRDVVKQEMSRQRDSYVNATRLAILKQPTNVDGFTHRVSLHEVLARAHNFARSGRAPAPSAREVAHAVWSWLISVPSLGKDKVNALKALQASAEGGAGGQVQALAAVQVAEGEPAGLAAAQAGDGDERSPQPTDDEQAPADE